MNLLEMSYEEVVDAVIQMGLEKYRADQLLDWVYKKRVFTFEGMTNLSKEHRALFREKFTVKLPRLIEKRVSKIDKTTKFLYELEDGNTIESVLLFHEGYATACISTQVGCPIKCAFCATGQSGYVRNLTVAEIVGQVLAVENDSGRNIRNVVYMGMGEPFLNYENVVKSLKILIHPKMKDMGVRRITLSTVGIPDRIVKFADEGLDVRLAISLHAASNEKRDTIVPLNRKYSIEEVLQAAKIYQEKTNRRITIEYILIRELNDFDEDARRLAKLLKDLKVYVNLIPVNPTTAGFERPSHWKMVRFKEILLENGIEAELRQEKGADIEAACGQLRLRGIRVKP
ncbi:MAG: 23S rRNA (adenine(2503)-C(2))-methyltransferase RlmN [Pseudothermotoga sp.]|uniref:23S rRNA (adenine(2503)-C(2))-methyltransferase RlmN n=1 Tax=Pseudothermotoga sp. TaxID=2033661 RepID=UPI000E9A899B|nr:23S rRNA (adenine(2503)-C(2))-methyltransferase RlmN [Pseudothermotoga sp.]HBT40044.1 23S rRNA (adenine(2503)-C(2))-methyltransferase RlmN [Pseudothermotoga sp.]HCO98413.1 23S rRNA (adenine(2503)-C(2))-methyltransferase RlmN [Pseudothermotoga sp.]